MSSSQKESEEIVAIVSGGINIDLFYEVENFPTSGQTFKSKSFKKDFGGKGFNCCVNLSKLGVKAAMMGCLGDDSDSGEVKKSKKIYLF